MLTFAVCAAMTAVLCGYLYWISSLLRRISDNLGDVDALAGDVIGHATTIVPDLQHANRTLGSISGALPLLYGLGEKTIAKKQRGHALSARRSTRVGAGQAGMATVANLVTVAIVAVAFSTVVILLQRTTSTASSIDAKAKRIAKTGQGINIATDSVIVSRPRWIRSFSVSPSTYSKTMNGTPSCSPESSTRRIGLASELMG